MMIVASNSLTVSNVNDGTQGIPGKPGTDGRTPYTHWAYAWSADGQDRFMNVYPGENLLQGTNQGLTNWAFGTGSGGQYVRYAFDIPNGQGITVRTTVAYTNWFWLGYKLNYRVLKQNTNYVLSFWAKSTDIDRTISARFANSGSANPVAYFGGVSLKSGVATKVVLKATTNDVKFTDQYLYLNSFNMLGGIDIWDLQIEEGTLATPWTPSPLDDPEGAYPKFIGTYTDYIADDSTDPSKYTWAKLRGEQGPKGETGEDGVAGKDGVGIKSTQIMYAQSTSGTTAPNTGWTAQVPTLIKGQYLWTQTTWLYTDNTGEAGYTVSYNAKDGNTGANGIAGKDGVGIKSTVIEYAVSSNGVTKPSTGWSTTIPTVAPGQFLWTRTTWSYTDSTNEVGYSVAQAGTTGSAGKDGIAGKDGVGVKATAITYAQSTSGTTPPTTGWTAGVPTLIKGQYLWTKTVWTYSDSATETGYTVSYNAKDGNNGSDGLAGKDGVGISSTLIEYVGAVSGTSEPTTGWSTTIPAVPAGQYLWTRTTWQYTDGTSEQGFTNALMGRTGAAGKDGVDGKDGEPGSKDVPVTTVSAAQPTTAKNGDIWYRSQGELGTGKVQQFQMYIYDNGSWVLAFPEGYDTELRKKVNDYTSETDKAISGITANIMVNAKTVEDAMTDIKNGQIATDKIVASKMSSADVTTLVGQTASGLTGKITAVDGKVTTLGATVDGLQTTVSGTDGLTSKITQLANIVDTKVSSADLSARITAGVDAGLATVQLTSGLSGDDAYLRLTSNGKMSEVSLGGDKIHITGETRIDNAVIKSANIESINAAKLVGGEIRGISLIYIKSGATAAVMSPKGFSFSKDGVEQGVFLKLNSAGLPSTTVSGTLHASSNISTSGVIKVFNNQIPKGYGQIYFNEKGQASVNDSRGSHVLQIV